MDRAAIEARVQAQVASWRALLTESVEDGRTLLREVLSGFFAAVRARGNASTNLRRKIGLTEGFAMFRWPIVRTLAILFVVVLGVVGIVSGQAQAPPNPMDQLLAEVRGLRAEVNQAASTSIRAQLLVARLQLQEQRINTVARQLTEVRNELARVEREQGEATAHLEHLGRIEAGPSQTSQQRAEVENVTPILKASLEQRQKQQQELQAQETTLSGLLADEQARWNDFNGRLDELERSLSPR